MDNPEFYAELEGRINEICSANIVTGGDRNLVLDYVLR